MQEPHRPEQALKRQILNILALVLTVGGGLYAAMAFVLWLQGSGSILDAIGGLVLALAGILVYALNRYDRVQQASFITIGMFIIVPTYFVIVEGRMNAGLLIFAAGIVFADFLVGGFSGLIVAMIDTLLYLGFSLAHEFGLLHKVLESPFLADVGAWVLIIYGLALTARIFTRGTQRFLQQAEERETALRAADEDKTRLLAELQAREEAQRNLLETVRELGSPIIPLAKGVIAMPLIGLVDSERAQLATTALLEGIKAHRARVVIVDITGVPVVDTVVAGALLRAAQGVRLLGAEAVLTGIRAEVAQTMVELGLDLSGVVTRATLQEGLAYALRSTGEDVTAGEGIDVA